jgi:pimeloyl-ACP methyl ester carboxylesterase
MPMPDPRTVPIRGRSLAWREQGEGAALVLIHGIGGSSESWAPLFDRFSRGYRVIAWDAPGYGDSETVPAADCTAEGYAARLASLLDMRGVTTAHLVGHSIGAPIAAALWQARASLVASLALVHPVAGFSALEDARRAELRAARLGDIAGRSMGEFGVLRAPQILGGRADAAVTAEVARIIGRIPEAGYRAMVEVMAAANLVAVLPGLAAPALVIAGEDDPVAPTEACRAIAAALPDAEFDAYLGIGHYMPLEDAPAFTARLEKFLGRHGGATRSATYL